MLPILSPRPSLLVLIGLSLGALSCSPGPASAGQPAPQGSAGRGMGGGFIELLMTGRDPAPRSAARSAPADLPAAMPDPTRTSRVVSSPAGNPYRQLEMEPDAAFDRQVVDYAGPHGPGTVIIDTPNKFLFLVQPGGSAIRYGIGVGRPGFTWAGVKSITRKAEWPDWTPPPEMLKRRPDLPRHMEGGEDNPLGARAMYLGSTLYRIHGTNEPNTIGTNVSSGCIRLRNEDVMDLYERVKVGTTVIVL